MHFCASSYLLALTLLLQVVPCCATPQLFPTRRLASGARVKKHGSLVQYLLEKDPRCRVRTLAFRGRNVVVFMTRADYARDRAAAARWVPPDYEPCARAAKRGDMALLQRLLAEGNPWNTHLCQGAAWSGQLAVLKWARVNGCPWSWEVVAQTAVRGDHAHVLRWAALASRGIADAVDELVADFIGIKMGVVEI